MAPVIEPVELSIRDLEAFLARLKEQVSAEDHDLAEKLIGSYLYLTDRIGQDRTTIAELRRLLGKTQVVVVDCIAHCRRYFVDVAGNFPDECRHVLEELGTVYKNDANARARKLSPEERLRFHQQESAAVMEELHTWLETQLAEKNVEPNFDLGTAINYALNHWDKLTLFLRVAGAPLDNNIC